MTDPGCITGSRYKPYQSFFCLFLEKEPTNKLLAQARRLGLVLNTDNPAIYPLPMFLTYSNDTNKIRRLTTDHNSEQNKITQEDQNKTTQEEQNKTTQEEQNKTIQKELFRATKCVILRSLEGVDKAGAINTIVNYFYGVEFENNYRFKVALNSEKPKESFWITVYEFMWNENSPKDFNLILIDIPNKRKVSKKTIPFILKMMKDFNGWRHPTVNGVVIVTKTPKDGYKRSKSGYSSKLEKCIRETLKVVEGNIQKHVLVLQTCADCEIPIRKLLLKMEIPEKSIFRVSNPVVYHIHKKEQEPGTQQLWNTCQRNLDGFLHATEQLDLGRHDVQPEEDEEEEKSTCCECFNMSSCCSGKDSTDA